MRTIEIYREHEKQYLDEILHKHGYHGLIPTNHILDKTVPGIGATHGEISDRTRNSIIIEPHKPVIEVKKERFKERLCAVMEGVKVKDITGYLESEAYPKKIITTPESFYKVIKALKSFDPDYRKNFFMLIDECEQLFSSCLFRNKLLHPLKEFFLFDNKALVSATPILPKAKEFKDFTILKLVPLYSFQKELLLLITNNVRAAARNVIASKQDDNRPFLIFTNCKKMILYLTGLEQVKKDYNIYCAEDLSDRFFKGQNIENLYSSVKDQNYKRFNFFTSRFFSAVDMFLPVKPHVLIITNVPQTRHSIIDPATDSIQISGRARNGIASITHISSLFPASEYKTEDCVLDDIDQDVDFIKLLNRFKEKSTDSTIHKAIDSLKDKQYISAIFDENGNPNEYLKHNFEIRKLLAFKYSSADLLYNEYTADAYFRVIKHVICEPFSDLDLLKLKRAKGKEKRKFLAEKLRDTIHTYHFSSLWSAQAFDISINKIRKLDELTFEIYKEFGLEYLTEINYSKSIMTQTLFDLKKEKGNNLLLMIDKIIATFLLDIPHYSDQAKTKLQAIYDEFDFQAAPGKRKHAKASDLEEYFECKLYNSKKRIDGKYKSYYILHRAKDKIAHDLKFLATDYFY